MPDTIAQELMAPFAEELHKTKTKKVTLKLTYVSWWEYAKRLNKVFGTNWSFEVLEYWIAEIGEKKQAIVFGCITATTEDGAVIKKMAFGGSEPRENITDLADEYKSASSDCLRKASTYFGIGLELIEKKKRERKKPASETQLKEKSKNGAEPIANQTTLDAIAKVAKEIGYKNIKDQAFIERVRDIVKKPKLTSLQGLRQNEAQHILERMQKRALEMKEKK